MSIVLPKEPIKATRKSPRILVLYGMPKVGKTKSLAELKDCLIIDAEGGSEMHDSMRLSANSTKDIYDIRNAIIEEGKARAAKGMTESDRFPYKYIALDTLDKIEEFAEVSATTKYKASVLGKKFEGRSVLELPNGSGYYYLRNELNDIVNDIAKVCPRLILITHIKEKLLNKGGEDVKVNDISLTGKMGSIICAKADAIGYMYHPQGKDLMVSFETQESTVMGARVPHLAGQKFVFDWNKIYVD
jgi:hypothetical protein